MPDTGDDEAERREREAAEWFFRRDGGFTIADEAAFRRWLRADVRRGAALAEIERTWQQAGAARDDTTAAVRALRRAGPYIYNLPFTESGSDDEARHTQMLVRRLLDSGMRTHI